MQNNPASALILWTIAAQIFMGIVTYEWLPASYRSSWIFFNFIIGCRRIFKYWCNKADLNSKYQLDS